MSGGADVDQKIQHVKRVQEVDEDCVTKKRKTDVGESNEDRRYPKKKVALLLAYSGKGYYGMQVQTSAGIYAFIHFLLFHWFKCVPCLSGIPDHLSSGLLRTTWLPRLLNLAAFPKTTEMTWRRCLSRGVQGQTRWVFTDGKMERALFSLSHSCQHI